MDTPNEALKRALSPTPAKLTQTELADDLGVTQQAVNNWCSGRGRPEPKHRKRIEELTGIPRTAWMTPEEREAAGVDAPKPKRGAAA